MARHARLGPSSSEIWLNCEAAPSLWSVLPPRQVGRAAAEGTLAHTLCEAALQINDVPWTTGDRFNVDGHEIEITDEMLNAVQLYVTTVLPLRDTAKWHCVETEVSLAWLWEPEPPPEEIFGTTDFASCGGELLDVVDFKFGRGKAVKPEFNTQLAIYGVGSLGKLKREQPKLAKRVSRVRLTIVQPRAGGEPIRRWEVPIGELLFWARTALVPAIERIANREPGPFRAGNHCWFCHAGVDCPTLRAFRIANVIDALPEYEEV